MISANKISREERRNLLEKLILYWFSKIEELSPERYEKMKENGELFFDLSTSFFSPDDVKTVLIEKFNYEDGGMDTNGCLWDFWIYLNKENGNEKFRKLVVSGTGMYGNLILDINAN